MDPDNGTAGLPILEDRLSPTLEPSLELVPVNILYTFSEVLVAILAVIGNAMTMYVFAVDRKLRRVTNYYIASLALADLLVGVLGVPFAILTSMGLPRNLWACIPMLSTLIVLCTISIFCLVAVSMDRYWAILYPLMYSRIMTGSIARRIILCCWLAGTFIGLMPLWWHEKDGLCLFTHIMHYHYLVFLYFFTIVFPGLLMAVFYAHIYSVVIKQAKLFVLTDGRTLRQIESHSIPTDTDSLQSTKRKIRKSLSQPHSIKFKLNSFRDSLREIKRSSSSTKIQIDKKLMEPLCSVDGLANKKLNNIKTMEATDRKGSGSSLALSQLSRPSRREVKAAKNLSIIVLFFLICWFPLYTINCVQAFCSNCPVPSQLLNFTIILSHANSAVNPLLYAYHMKDFRLALQVHILQRLGYCTKKGRNGPLSPSMRQSVHLQATTTPTSTFARTPILYPNSPSCGSDFMRAEFQPLNSPESTVCTRSATIPEDIDSSPLQNVTTDNSMLTLDPGISKNPSKLNSLYLISPVQDEVNLEEVRAMPMVDLMMLENLPNEKPSSILKRRLTKLPSLKNYAATHLKSLPHLHETQDSKYHCFSISGNDSPSKRRSLSYDDVFNGLKE